jgi:hypothetical protein
VPRFTKSDRQREQREIDAVRRATERAAHDLGVAVAASAVEADELATGRDFESGTATFRSPFPVELPDDPYEGARRQIERLEEILERREASLKHAGTDPARSGALRNLQHLEAEIQKKREALWEKTENLVMDKCRYPACWNEIAAENVYATGGVCASCRSKSTTKGNR